jgi:hypothetical protein
MVASKYVSYIPEVICNAQKEETLLTCQGPTKGALLIVLIQLTPQLIATQFLAAPKHTYKPHHPRTTPQHPQYPSSPRPLPHQALKMCKEMNAPVLPESKKVNATATHTYDLSADYNFLFDSAFTDAIQMNQYEHDCLCQPSTPMVHYCCPGCRERTYTPTEEDRKDLKAVLVDYDFAETKPEKGIFS